MSVPVPLDSGAATEIVDRYLERHAATDLDGVVALFAADARLEDPVGSSVSRGIQEIREFYREVHRRNGRLVVERVGPVLVGGREIAAHVRARLDITGAEPMVDVIYVLRIGEDDRIVELRAFF